ncbi:hypothetical protein KDW_40620 [Dictyobacter vulcani]|uniref:Uncharacterized protein n=1 Tax=Dictyobacter vulcani TaxID=2607529 RepID=A0A5J4KTV7_9CHLR|nr:hypothetical protein KDW_40620 [Dictyobacter vulcani]
MAARLATAFLQETLKANPYEYADDNPVNYVDPSGAFSVKGTVIYLTYDEASFWLFAELASQ